jgi:outer membrane immunogenic protein
MRRSGLWYWAAAIIMAASSQAWAADMPLKAPPPPFDPDPWTGFFGGPHFGYGWGDKTWIDNFPTPDGELDADAHVKGFIGGLQGGYNWKFNHVLIGVEGDFTWSGIKSDFSCFAFGNQICSAKPEWFATVAGRLGWVQGSALFYLKGGAAWTQDHFTDLATCSGGQPTSRAGITAACGDTFFGDQTRVGWLAGAGIEVFFAKQWSAFGEYNYMDFGARSVTFLDGGNGFFTEEIHQRINLIKVGVNYHFWPAQPSGALGYAAPIADSAEERDNYVTAFTGVDVGKHSVSGFAGALISPYKDLDTSGLRFWMMGEGGAYKYPADGSFIRGHYESGDALAGYSWEGDNYSIALLGGFNAINHTLNEIDTTNPVQGTRFGFKVRADATVNPTPKTLTAGEAEYSTAFNTYSSKAKFGYDFTNGKQIFFGPEAGASGDDRYNQWRIGAHVSQIKFWSLQVDVSAGFARDSVVGDGAYGTVEISTSF